MAKKPKKPLSTSVDVDLYDWIVSIAETESRSIANVTELLIKAGREAKYGNRKEKRTNKRPIGLVGPATSGKA